MSGGVGVYLDIRKHGLSFGWYDSKGLAVGEGGGIGVSVTGATSIQSFEGNSATLTAGAGEAVSVTAGGNDTGGSGGLSLGVGAGIVGESSYTTVHPWLHT